MKKYDKIEKNIFMINFMEKLIIESKNILLELQKSSKLEFFSVNKENKKFFELKKCFFKIWWKSQTNLRNKRWNFKNSLRKKSHYFNISKFENWIKEKLIFSLNSLKNILKNNLESCVFQLE